MTEKALAVEQPYLLLPVKTGATKRRIQFIVGGRIVREFEIELADKEPDFYVFSDISAFRGQKLRIAGIDLPETFRGVDLIVQSDKLPGDGEMYQEPLRPLCHFTSQRGRLNDPNGLVFYHGAYHLFYQLNPYGCSAGNLCWGHAISHDLVHWIEKPIALYPRKYGDFCFSGSGVVDWKNTTRFQDGPEPPLVLAYTSTGRGQCLAYSNDGGENWREYKGNPVLVHGGFTDNPHNSKLPRHQSRDPKIFWYEPAQHWVMAVFETESGDRADRKDMCIAVYISPDLKTWELTQQLEGWYECPDLFPLPVDGDSTNIKWVMFGGDFRYVVGEFDGRKFTIDSDRTERFDPYIPVGPYLHEETYKYNGFYGKHFFAAQTFNDMTDGRRVMIGWLKGSNFSGMPFNQQMSFPCELSLRSTEDGIRLFVNPVEEIKSLHVSENHWEDLELKSGISALDGVTGEALHILAEIIPNEAEVVGLNIHGVSVDYHFAEEKLKYQYEETEVIEAPLRLNNGKLKLEIVVDRGSLEIFANDGRVFIPVSLVSDSVQQRIKAFSSSEGSVISSLKVYELQSIWDNFAQKILGGRVF